MFEAVCGIIAGLTFWVGVGLKAGVVAGVVVWGLAYWEFSVAPRLFKTGR